VCYRLHLQKGDWRLWVVRSNPARTEGDYFLEKVNFENLNRVCRTKNLELCRPLPVTDSEQRINIKRDEVWFTQI
jgi:hypothetical protein